MKTSRYEAIDCDHFNTSLDNIALNSSIFTTISSPYTLITGASQGIGRAMAFECAERGMNLILVALPDEDLKEVRQTIEMQYLVKVHHYEIDLTLPQSPKQLYDWCIKHNLMINTLINNAGIGQQGGFEKLEINKKLSLMQLNILVPVSLTHLFLPMLKRYSASYILNVGSVASFTPIPYKCLYSASKNFVLTFSRSLRYELNDTNVTVCCLCPGPTLTNKQNQLNIENVSLKGKIMELLPSQVARHAIKGMLKGKEIIVPGWKHKIIAYLFQFLPGFLLIPFTGQLFAYSK